MRSWPVTLALLFLLAACAPGPVGDPPPIGRVAFQSHWIEGAGGTRLAYSEWPASGRERAVIVALHGYGDWGPSTFHWAAEHWAKKGITTYAYDQRGFGRNPTARKWPGPDILASDLIAVTAEIRRRHPGRKLVVVGHSMGGGVALTAAAQGLEADALVLAGPAIAGGRQIGLPQRFGAWAVAVLARDRRFTGDGIVRIDPTDNRQVLRLVASSPYHFADPSGRELMGLVRVMDAAAAAAPVVRVPTLTLMGARDEILLPQAVRQVHDRIAGRAGYVLYPDGWHWLFRDLQAPRVWDDVADFVLDGRIPAAAGKDP